MQVNTPDSFSSDYTERGILGEHSENMNVHRTENRVQRT